MLATLVPNPPVEFRRKVRTVEPSMGMGTLAPPAIWLKVAGMMNSLPKVGPIFVPGGEAVRFVAGAMTAVNGPGRVHPMRGKQGCPGPSARNSKRCRR